MQNKSTFFNLFQSPPKRRLVVRESVAGLAINFDRDALFRGNAARYFILESEKESVGCRLADDRLTVKTTKVFQNAWFVGGLHCMFKREKSAKTQRNVSDQVLWRTEINSWECSGSYSIVVLLAVSFSTA